MKIIRSTDFQLNNDTAVAIGKFDGIHRGHRELLDRIIAKKAEGLEASVFTFDKAPMELFGGKMIPSLTTMEEKIRIFEYLSIDNLIIYPLTLESAAIAPEDYITKILCKQMRMKYIAAGEDLSFGDKGRGDANLLKQYSENFDIDIVSKLVIDGEEVSSSLIRDIVSKGDMEKASKFIGVPYAVSGVVSHGKKLGRTIGFPTVNIIVPKEKLMPPFGVYFASVSIEGRHFLGIANIGNKPTVNNLNTVFAETHIFDFDEDVYGKRITVKLLKFVRSEKKFSSVDELKEQISVDIKHGREYFSDNIIL